MLYDVIVIGAGIQGCWTALHLSKAKKKVLLLEQFSLPHTRGSSFGESRITRCSYTTPHHAKMMPEAFQEWNNLEKQVNKELYIECGLVSISNEDHLSKLQRVLTDLNVSHQYLKAEEISKQFPGLSPGNRNAVVEYSAGALKSKQCMTSLLEVFVSNGGQLQDSQKVLKINPISAKEVLVSTDKATYSCAAVVLTCGPWINKVLEPLDVQLPTKVTKLESIYWKQKESVNLYSATKFPATIIDSELGYHMYSIPIIEYPGMMKVCCHFREVVDPDYRQIQVVEPNTSIEKKTEIRTSMVKKHFPSLLPYPALVETCVQTLTPDEDLILDHHPKYSNVIIGAGFSGHGFKISPVVGKILADLVMNKKPAFPIHHFRLSRFKNVSSAL